MTQALGGVPKGAIVVASRQDHPALLSMVEAAAAGLRRSRLAMPGGVPNADDLRELEGASLVALSACHHELGTSLLDVLGKVPASAVRVIDAVQAAPWVSLATLQDDRTFYAVSGAKLGAPLGIGAVRVPSKTFYAARQSGKPLEGESPPWLTDLAEAMDANPALRASMEAKTPCIADAVSPEDGRETPAGHTWHHATAAQPGGESGVMQLVPSSEHTPGSRSGERYIRILVQAEDTPNGRSSRSPSELAIAKLD